MRSGGHFIRCWSDTEGNRSREQLPKSWWMSDDYHIITTRYAQPRMVKLTPKRRDELRYGFDYIGNDGQTYHYNPSVAGMVGLVFGCRYFAGADRILAEIGLEATRFDSEWQLELHHIREYHPEWGHMEDNDPRYLMWLPRRWHMMFRRLIGIDDQPVERKQAVYKDLFELMDRDNIMDLEITTALQIDGVNYRYEDISGRQDLKLAEIPKDNRIKIGVSGRANQQFQEVLKWAQNMGLELPVRSMTELFGGASAFDSTELSTETKLAEL